VNAALGFDNGPDPTRLNAMTRQVYRFPVVSPNIRMLGGDELEIELKPVCPPFELVHVA
jgi:hypothetical protein